MKTILVFASSLDGKITRWGDSYVKSWTSKNDQEYFSKLWHDAPIIIMGSKTFKPEQVRPETKHLHVVMTSNPSKYGKWANEQLEFTDASPSALSDRFKKEGAKQILLVGGAHIATSFLKEQLIDEIWLTIEPKIFGSGGNFVSEDKLDIDLQLISCDSVNDAGTLMTKYKVLKH